MVPLGSIRAAAGARSILQATHAHEGTGAHLSLLFAAFVAGGMKRGEAPAA
jgi:hypothetical protein